MSVQRGVAQPRKEAAANFSCPLVHHTMKATDITWDIALEDKESHEEAKCRLALPDEVEIPEGLDAEDVSDWLSDKFGFCICGFNIL